MRKIKPKATPDRDREILTRKQLMEWMQISHGTLDKLMNHGELPHFRIGKKVLFVKADVLAYLKSKPK